MVCVIHKTKQTGYCFVYGFSVCAMHYIRMCLYISVLITTVKYTYVIHYAMHGNVFKGGVLKAMRSLSSEFSLYSEINQFVVIIGNWWVRIQYCFPEFAFLIGTLISLRSDLLSGTKQVSRSSCSERYCSHTQMLKIMYDICLIST